MSANSFAKNPNTIFIGFNPLTMDNSFLENIPIADTSPPQALDIGISVPTKKKRDVQKDSNAFGGRFDIVDGKGRIIAKVYPPNYEEKLQSSSSLPEDFGMNFMSIFEMVERIDKRTEERLT